MTRRISRVSVHRTSVTVALAYALLGVIGWPLAFLDESAGNHAALWGLPVLFAAAGYAFSVLYCVLYNVAARWTGGIELRVEDTPQS